jgi:hypothetical protein
MAVMLRRTAITSALAAQRKSGIVSDGWSPSGRSVVERSLTPKEEREDLYGVASELCAKDIRRWDDKQ